MMLLLVLVLEEWLKVLDLVEMYQVNDTLCQHCDAIQRTSAEAACSHQCCPCTSLVLGSILVFVILLVHQLLSVLDLQFVLQLVQVSMLEGGFGVGCGSGADIQFEALV